MTYPTISHFIESITGGTLLLPIQTFGFFIVLAFIFGHYFIQKEFLRFEINGFFKPVKQTNTVIILANIFTYIINGILSFLLGYKIIHIISNYNDFATNPQAELLSPDGNLYLACICLIVNILYVYLNNKKKGKTDINVPIKPSQLSWNFLVVAAISGLIGAKIFAIFEGDVDQLFPWHWKDNTSYLNHLKEVLFSFSGLTFYGGLIFGTIAVIIYGWINKMHIARLADGFAPSLILAYGIGRLGCHFSGDGDWGIVSNLTNKPSFLPDWLWGYTFPHNVIKKGELINGCCKEFIKIPILEKWGGGYREECLQYCYELVDPVYPTALYEALFCIGAFIILWKIRKHISIPGVLFFIYLIINGIERFSIETIRITKTINELTGTIIPIIGKLTQAQFIGIIIICIGIIGILATYLPFLRTIKKSTNESVKE